jgi:hypothetical protein
MHVIKACYNAHMDESKLNEFSKYIYSQLCAYIPQLITQAVEQPQSNGNFFLRVLSPIKEERVWLGIYTDADPVGEKPEIKGEVTWEFDDFHSHSFGRSAEEAFEWLKNELDALLEGRIFVGSSREKGKWIRSTTIDQNELADFLAGKLVSVRKKQNEIQINHVLKLSSIPDSEKDRIIGAIKHSAPVNRIVGWQNIYLK